MSELDSPRLEIGDGFHLTRIRHSDKAAYLEHFADEEIARNTLAIPFPYTGADADWWLDHCEHHRRSPEIRFAVREPGGYLIGAIGAVGNPPPDIPEVEIGYWLASAYRGRGLMPLVINAFAKHAFERLGVNRLVAKPFAFNLASHRALEKARFSRGKFLQQHFCKHGQLLDAVAFTRFAANAHHSR